MELTVAEYLTDALKSIHVDKLFALSGDYIAKFLAVVDKEKSITRVSGACEQEVAYSADGYARATGNPGVIVVTYGVGAFNTLNAVTSSFVEQIPIILVNGAPRAAQFISQQFQGILYHHMIDQGQRTEIDVFRQVTVAAHLVNNPKLAPRQIDEAIYACLTMKAPVYLEVDSGIWDKPCGVHKGLKLSHRSEPRASDTDAVTHAVDEAMKYINSAKQPFIWAGIEIQRCGAQKLFKEFLKETKIQYATNLYSKGVISETEFPELFVGVLDGGFASTDVLKALGETDLLLQFGVWLTDVEVGKKSLMELTPKSHAWLSASKQCVGSSNRRFFVADVNLKDFLQALLDRIRDEKKKFALCVDVSTTQKRFSALEFAEPSLTYDRFVAQINRSGLIDDNTTLFADASLVIFPAASDIRVNEGGWQCETIWGSIGYTMGGSIGYKLGKPSTRVAVFVGDGGLQNCPTGLSTMAREKLNNIVFVMVNGTYSIDQFLVNPDPFVNPKGEFEGCNILPKWDYVKLAEAFGGKGFLVRSTKELGDAIASAKEITNTFSLIAVAIPENDLPQTLRNLIPNSKILSGNETQEMKVTQIK